MIRLFRLLFKATIGATVSRVTQTYLPSLVGQKKPTLSAAFVWRPFEMHVVV